MNYNLHPIFVHFPIAFLFVYSLVKIIPFRRWFPRVAWRQIERVLLVVGVLGAFAALATGDDAEHSLVHPNHPLIEMHSTFAALATWLYAALLAGEAAAVINSLTAARGKSWAYISATLRWIERIFCNPMFSCVLAILALIAIAVTGLLGGTIVYGTTADPLAAVVLKILGITL